MWEAVDWPDYGGRAVRLPVAKSRLRLVAEGKLTQVRLPSNRPTTRLRPGSSHVVGTEIRVIITKPLRAQAVKDITLEEAIASGFRTRQDFWDEWEHGPDCWVIEFVVDRSHTPNLLSRRGVPAYTSSPHEAMDREPEAVDRTVVDDYAKMAEANSELLREQRRERLAEDYREARQLAKAIGVDIRRQESAIGRQVDAIWRKAKGAEKDAA